MAMVSGSVQILGEANYPVLQAPNCRETKPRQRWSNSIKEWLRVCAVEYTTPREKEMALTTRVSGSNGNDVFHRGVSPNENEMSDG